jgi:hypothetical protein
MDDVSERVSARGQHAQLSHRHIFDRQVRNYIKETVTRHEVRFWEKVENFQDRIFSTNSSSMCFRPLEPRIKLKG